MKLRLQTVENSYAQSLTINGDFQINQRGKNSYIGTNSWSYTVDMWRLNGFASLNVLSNGVKLKNNDDYSGQTYFAQVIKLENKSYTAVVKINNISGSAKLSFDNISATKQLSKGVNMLTFNGNNASSFVFTIEGKGSYIDIEYADLFEGSIAYNHKKEDKATALMRCQSFIVKISNIFSGFTDKTGKFITFPCDKIINMQGTPILIGSIPLILRIEGSESTPTATSATVKKESGEIVLTFSSNYSSIASKTISGRMNNDIIIVTSEPM